MSDLRINPILVETLYSSFLEEHGQASCGKVADYLNSVGVKSPRGYEVSRMAVWRLLKNSNNGRKLLSKTIRRMNWNASMARK